jgi:hypothetical protein
MSKRKVIVKLGHWEMDNKLKLDCPRISKRWLFSISGLLAPLVGIIGGITFTSTIMQPVIITYSIIWGITALINTMVMWADFSDHPLFIYEPTRKDIANTCFSLQKEVNSLNDYSERLMKALEPQLWPEAKDSIQQQLTERKDG